MSKTTYWFGYYKTLGKVAASRWSSDSRPSPGNFYTVKISEEEFQLPITVLMKRYPSPEPPS